MARGKLVQEPFLFNTVVGQQFALSYLVGELHAEFVDAGEDTIGTSRNVLVWDAEANAKLMEWGQKQVQKIAREWANKRQKDNIRELEAHDLYRSFKDRANETGNRRALRLADSLVRQAISKNPTAGVDVLEPIIKQSLDFLEYDAFWEIAQEVAESGVEDVGKLLGLFKEWEVVEAKEMARVTEGRISTSRETARPYREGRPRGTNAPQLPQGVPLGHRSALDFGGRRGPVQHVAEAAVSRWRQRREG